MRTMLARTQRSLAVSLCVVSVITVALHTADAAFVQATPPAADETRQGAPSAPQSTSPGGPGSTPAQPDTPAVAAAAQQSAIRATFDTASRSEEQKAKATALLAEIAQAYRTAPAFTDTVTLDIRNNGEASQETFAVAFGQGSDARLAFAGATMTANGAKVTIVADEPADRALQVPLAGDLLATLRATLPEFQVPLTLFDLRAGRELTVEALSLDTLANPRIAGLRDEGGSKHVLLEGDNGLMTAVIDGQSKFLLKCDAIFTPPGAPRGYVFEARWTHTPKSLPGLDAPLTPHIGDRKIVTTVDDYFPMRRTIQAGAPCPDWTLTTLDGSTVSLSSLKGSVVVLDFWATWCGPCKRALPSVNEFGRWAASSGQPIKVFAVNTLQQGDAAARTKVASDWWNAQNFSIPLLLDLDDSLATAMGIRVLPTTVIIGADGVVRSVTQEVEETGEAMVEALKKAATDALK